MRPPRRGAAARVQQPSFARVIVSAGAVAAGAAAYFRVPAVPVLWLSFVIAAWAEPPVILTGRKDSAGFPTPAHPGEERNLRRFRFWRSLRFRLMVPGRDWLPGWPPLAAWFAALAAALAAFAVPVSEVVPYSTWLNGATAFVLVATVAAARRAGAPEGSGCPGVRVTTAPGFLRSRSGRMAAVAGGVTAAAAVCAVAVFCPESGVWVPTYRALAAVGAGLVAFTLVVSRPWSSFALAEWRVLCAQRELWTGRWLALRFDPPPRITRHYAVGQATVDEFAAPPQFGSQAFMSLATKITPAVGAGWKVAVLEVPDSDRRGDPQAGTVHPLDFQVVSWPSTELPDLTDPATPGAVADLFARCAFSWAADSLGSGRPVMVAAERITVDPQGTTRDRAVFDTDGDGDSAGQVPTDDPESPPTAPAAYRSRWAFPGGPDLAWMRENITEISASFGCEVLIDHRNDVMYYGALSADETVFTDGVSERLAELSEEDHWRDVWKVVLKQGANPPTLQHPQTVHAVYADPSNPSARPVGVTRVAFTTRLGVDPAEYRGLESKLATALTAAPFVALTGWPAPGQQAGSRHPQAFALYFSDGPVPGSPAQVADDGEVSRWILAGQINAAFDAARLARPEITAARALTSVESFAHIWEVGLHLYGGVTLADVRSAAAKIQRQLAVPWLRIDESAAGCTLYVGERPDVTRRINREDRPIAIANPRRDGMKLRALDWDQAFADSGIRGNNGLLPRLERTGTLPRNRQVSVLDFALPPGLDLPQVKAGLKKLCVATGNSFIEPSTGPGGASNLRLLVSVDNPLPERVGIDFAEVDRSHAIPFATGVDGESIVFDASESPHLLLAGVTGSGKSSLAQTILYGAAVRGAEIYVVDPTKGAADFKFLEPYARAFATSTFEAAAALRAVYGEVERRKAANAAAGVGSYRDLPEPPAPIYLMIDEFTSLMGQSPVPKPSDDAGLEAERDAIIADNAARGIIGTLAGKLAREARSAGVTLLLGTQKLSAKMLDQIPGNTSDLKTNLARTLLGSASFGDRASALRVFDSAPVLEGAIPKGRGLWEPLSATAAIMQVWYSTQNEMAEQLALRLTAVGDDDRTDLAPFMPEAANPADDADAEEAADEDRVIDAGDFRFDMDDLDLEASEPGVEDLPDPADEVTGEVSGSEERLSPDPVVAPDPPHCDGLVVVPRDSAAAVAGLGAHFAVFDGGCEPCGGEVIPVGASATGWEKVTALDGYLEAEAAVERVVWVDPDLAGVDDAFGVELTELAAEMLHRRGIEPLLIAQPNVSDTELERIADFLVGEPGSSADRPPAAAEPDPSAGGPDDWGDPDDDPFAPQLVPTPHRVAAQISDEDDPFA